MRLTFINLRIIPSDSPYRTIVEADCVELGIVAHAHVSPWADDPFAKAQEKFARLEPPKNEESCCANRMSVAD